MAPYLREGLPEVRRRFAKLFGCRGTAFDNLETVPDARRARRAPGSWARQISAPRVFSRLYGRAELLHRAAGRARQPRLCDPQHRPSLRGYRRDAGGRPRRLHERRRRHVSGRASRKSLRNGGAEDETMAAVDANRRTRRNKFRLLRGYLGGLHRTGIAFAAMGGRQRGWVLDRLPEPLALDPPPAGSPPESTTGRLGVFGHSMGGVTGRAILRRGCPVQGRPQS